MEDGDLMDGWKLPRETYNAALENARDEHGVGPGRGDLAAGEREHAAVLPTAVRNLTTAASGWDWKRVGRTDDTLTVEDAPATCPFRRLRLVKSGLTPTHR